MHVKEKFEDIANLALMRVSFNVITNTQRVGRSGKDDGTIER